MEKIVEKFSLSIKEVQLKQYTKLSIPRGGSTREYKGKDNLTIGTGPELRAKDKIGS